MCNVPCGLYARADRQDGKMWRCRNCNTRRSIRNGSFFSHSQLTLPQLIMFIYLWSIDLPLESIQRQCGINSDTTGVDWANFLRGVCRQDLQANPLQLGGMDMNNGDPIIVEIDESKFFHRKYHRGNWRPGHWVFGAVERGTGRCLLQEVQNRDRATLEPIITQWVLPGTRIISDGWAAYNRLHQLNGGIYMHDVVVHEHNFVDPIHRDIHTNNVESMWMHAKRKLRRQFGTSEALFPSYLDEFMWRKRVGPNKFGEMLIRIRQFYPV